MSQQILVLYCVAIGCVLSSLPLTRVDKTHCRHWGNGSHFAAYNFFVCQNVVLLLVNLQRCTSTRAMTARTKVAQTGNDYDAIACTDSNCRNRLPSLISFPTCRQSYCLTVIIVILPSSTRSIGTLPVYARTHFPHILSHFHRFLLKIIFRHSYLVANCVTI